MKHIITTLALALCGMAMLMLNANEDPVSDIVLHASTNQEENTHCITALDKFNLQKYGYITYHVNHFDNEGWISALFVNEQARGKGIGSKLFNAVADDIRSKNCTALRLLALEQSVTFYQALGVMLDKKLPKPVQTFDFDNNFACGYHMVLPL